METRHSYPSMRRTYRLLLRIHSVETLRPMSSQGTYCKIYVGDTDMTHGSSARPSLKRFLSERDVRPSMDSPKDQTDGTSMSGSPRIVKTQVRKENHRTVAVWKEKFEIAVYDPMTEVFSVRLKSMRLMTTSTIGACAMPLRDVRDETIDRWINLFDSNKRVSGRLRVQMRLVGNHSTTSRREENDTHLTMPRGSIAVEEERRRSIEKEVRRNSINRAASRRLSGIVGHPVEVRTSSSTAASDSVSSDYSIGRLSANIVAPYSPNDNNQTEHDARRESSKGVKQDGYWKPRSPVRRPDMTRSNQDEDDVDKQPWVTSKDDRSPRTTDNTTVSSEEEDGVEGDDTTIEFDFDTRTVRPSSRISINSLRSTALQQRDSSRSTAILGAHPVEDLSDDEVDEEMEDDEFDVDQEPEGPRVPLRSTITRLLRRKSVNIVMDEDEEEDDDEEEDMMNDCQFLPLLDQRESFIHDIDCAGQYY